ncbi:MAG: hypothetical protein KA155_04720 [Alphaproteobacteria bacterium]|nr:hypothetical protein [Alphaproteobacteria bacterium]
MKALWKFINNHWIMTASMLLMGGAWALATYGAKASFLNIGAGYFKHMFYDGFQALGAGLKAFGVATGNLLKLFGVNTSAMPLIDPATLTSSGADLMSHAPLKTSALDTLEVTDKFASVACAPGMELAQDFGHAAHHGMAAAMSACTLAPSV